MRARTSVRIALAAAAASLLSACATTTQAGPATTANPRSGIATSAVATSNATPTPVISSALTQVANWWTGGGQAQATKLASDMSAIIATTSNDPTTMGNACNTFSGDITTAQSNAPIPDAQAQQHWSAALDHYQQAATDCVAATSTMNTDLMNKATTELTAGSSELSAATARIRQITAGG
ncbi:hypothetical protein [Streptacidiphilus anmyonensis]|uniref:hypothetical protein n=1 Tax=Streptacidiphilus anmyonensis TaxID=405782 RepID=UPI0005A88E88|nr:hypothetical protein [Streptacidiphilus anmyonensis]